MKLVRIVIIITGVVFLNSCASDQSKESTDTVDSLTIRDTATTISLKDTASGKNDYIFTDIVKVLPENEKELDYNENFLSNYEAIQQSKEKMVKRVCENSMFPESIVCPDTVYFAWKRSINEFALVSFMTIEWGAKGPTIIYHLMTVENSTGESIAFLPDWAAAYAFAIENPEGGTSAGEKFVPGSITNNPVLRISTEDENGKAVTFELSPDGFFVEPYAQFDAETNLQ